MTAENVNVVPLGARVPDGWKMPVCQREGCNKASTWLTRGNPSMTVCDEHLVIAINTLSKRA